jgi:hypothetical protein
MKAVRRSVLAITLACAIAPAARAQVTLAENYITQSVRGLGNNAYSYSDFVGAENFSLSSTYDITKISHVGYHPGSSAQPTSIDWWLFGYNQTQPGKPGTSLFSGTSSSFTYAVEDNCCGYQIGRYTIDLTAVTLGAGNYWVGFRNNTVSNDPHWAFAGGGTSMDGISAETQDNFQTWGTFGGTEFAFRVEGQAAAVAVAPEPSSILLFGTGAGVMFVGVRRRKRDMQ